MKNFDASKIDFYALQIMLQIHKDGSLSSAAKALGLSQSSLSYTLDRLREALDDPLFVRLGRGIAPTKRCDLLIPKVRELCLGYEALRTTDTFSPQYYNKCVTIGCNYYERIVLIPELSRRLFKLAPNIRLRIVNSGTGGFRDLLEEKTDILISPLENHQSGLMVRTLFRDHYVCLLTANDPRQKNFSLEDYKAGKHIAIKYSTDWAPFYLKELDWRGIVIEPIIDLPSASGVSELMDIAPFIMTVPSGLIPSFSSDFISVPAPFSVEFSIKLFWTARNNEDGLSQWLRALIFDVAKSQSRKLGLRHSQDVKLNPSQSR